MNVALGPLRIGDGERVVVIAELSGNHNGDRARAIALLRAAKRAGADAVKLQTYTADTLTMDAPGPWFRIEGGPWHGRRLYDLYQEASTPWEWHEELFAEAAHLGLPCFSTPFDPTSVDFLERLGCPFYKVASFEIVDIPLLTRVAATRKPVVMSTGMASLAEIDLAVRTLRAGGCPGIVLLNCVSAYPAPPEAMHLGNMAALAATFGCPIGLSDHTLSATATIAAVALGARLIEKHLCLRRADGGPDAGFSLEPEDFAALVRAVRETEAATAGPAHFGTGQAEAGSIVFRKSLFAARDIAAGARLVADDVRCIRPGHGLPPAELPRVIGRAARGAIARGTPLAWELLS
ncbi:MAG TPA: pseudaminic acid synthase [Planctomycetota bacterium]|nr:pseudaminic acid synthase [Planctomycetota bacterium]